MGDVLGGGGGAGGPRRAADGCHLACAPGQCRGGATAWRHTPRQEKGPESKGSGPFLFPHPPVLSCVEAPSQVTVGRQQRRQPLCHRHPAVPSALGHGDRPACTRAVSWPTALVRTTSQRAHTQRASTRTVPPKSRGGETLGQGQGHRRER